MQSHLQQGLGELALLIYDRSLVAVDSDGNMPLDPNWLRSCLVPWLPVRVPRLLSAVRSLVRAGLLLEYESDGSKFGHRVGFCEQGGTKCVEWPRPALPPPPSLLSGDEVAPYHPDGITPARRATPRRSAYRGEEGESKNNFHPGTHTTLPEHRLLPDIRTPEDPASPVTPRARASGNGASHDAEVLIRAVAAAVQTWNADAARHLRLSPSYVPEAMVKAVCRSASNVLHFEPMKPENIGYLFRCWLTAKLIGRKAAAPENVDLYVPRSFALWCREHAEDLKSGRALRVLSPAKRLTRGASRVR